MAKKNAVKGVPVITPSRVPSKSSPKKAPGFPSTRSRGGVPTKKFIAEARRRGIKEGALAESPWGSRFRVPAPDRWRIDPTYTDGSVLSTGGSSGAYIFDGKRGWAVVVTPALAIAAKNPEPKARIRSGKRGPKATPKTKQSPSR